MQNFLKLPDAPNAITPYHLNALKLPNAFNAYTLHPYTLNNTPHSSRVSFLIPERKGVTR